MYIREEQYLIFTKDLPRWFHNSFSLGTLMGVYIRCSRLWMGRGCRRTGGWRRWTRRRLTWCGLLVMTEFVLGGWGQGLLTSCLDTYQLLDDPMKIGNHFFEGRNLAEGLYRRGPPRQRHDCKKYAVFAVSGKLTPAGIVASLPRKWPLFCVALFWLSRRPPFYPLGPIGGGISDGRYFVE